MHLLKISTKIPGLPGGRQRVASDVYDQGRSFWLSPSFLRIHLLPFVKNDRVSTGSPFGWIIQRMDLLRHSLDGKKPDVRLDLESNRRNALTLSS